MMILSKAIRALVEEPATNSQNTIALKILGVNHTWFFLLTPLCGLYMTYNKICKQPKPKTFFKK